MSEESKYSTISFPKDVVEAIKNLIKELRYWPSVTSFAREAVIEKLRMETKVLKERRERAEREGVDKGKES